MERKQRKERMKWGKLAWGREERVGATERFVEGGEEAAAPSSLSQLSH